MTSATRVRVWDLPTRLAHWLIVAGVAFSWWTAESGRMDWHRYSGHVLLGVVLFRLFWGFAGATTARFAHFVRGPRAVVDYLRARAPLTPGHNPLGALSVLALLATLAVQIGLGLIAVDVDGIESGPLSMYVSFATGRTAAKWHHRIFDGLMWLIALHVVAVLFYLLVRRQNLIAAMFTGEREYPAPPAETVRFASRARLVIGIILAGALTWMVARAFQF